MNRCILTCVFLVLIWGSGCEGDSRFTPITKDIGRGSSLTLYEGLPHQSWDAELLKKELATKKTVTIHGYPFYERPLSVSPTDVEKLRGLSAAAASFSPYGGPKACGAYHPDYCLSWKEGEAVYDLLICFSCHEMKFYGPKHESLADIRKDAFDQFQVILKRYQDQRPKAE